jgi:hypothetical protein
MKRSVGRMFINGFIKSVFIVAFLSIAGVVGYQATMHFWQIPGENDAVVAYKEQPEAGNNEDIGNNIDTGSITEASVDDISKNLIFSYDEKTNEINKLVLEIFHCKNKKLTYITIPLRTQLTMSDSLYRKLILIHAEIPQMMKLSSISKYFDEETIFPYSVLMIEDLLDIDISYYTALPKSTYDTIFTEKKAPQKDKENDASIPVESFTDEYIEFIKTLDTEDKISDYIEEIYPTVQSNLDLSQKMNYLESYHKTPISSISFELIKGNDRNSAYEIDSDLAARQLGGLLQE